MVVAMRTAVIATQALLVGILSLPLPALARYRPLRLQVEHELICLLPRHRIAGRCSQSRAACMLIDGLPDDLGFAHSSRPGQALEEDLLALLNVDLLSPHLG